MRKHRRPGVELLLAAGVLLVLSCRPGSPTQQESRKRGLAAPAAGERHLRFHAIPAHAVPPCATCHIEAGVNKFQTGPAQCGACHQDGSVKPDRPSNMLGRTDAALLPSN